MTKVGDLISRIGKPTGNYFAPANVPAWARSLPPYTASMSENTFTVVKPFTVYAEKSMPWFGQPGGGIQFLSILNQSYLEKFGFIKLISK